MMDKLSRETIEAELIAITSQFLTESGERKREIKITASLQRHLGIDSLARSELFQRFEKKFTVTLPDQLLAEADTLADIADYLQKTTPGLKQTVKDKVIITHGEKSLADPTYTKTLSDILLLYGEQSPNKIHIYFEDEDGQVETISYEKLLKFSLRIASSLRELGLKEGETVAIMLPTKPAFFYSFFGVLFAGGIPVPIYPPFRMHMLEGYAKQESHILRNAEVRILITFERAENLSHLLRSFVPSLKKVTTVDQLLQPQEIKKIFHAKSDNIGLIQYTSGSTSDPKGVVLTHDNLLSNIRAYGKAIRVTSDDVTVSWLPLYHDLGLIGLWLGSLYHGVPLILMTPFSFLNHPERWLWAIHYHRGTLSGAPNFAYELCLRKIHPALIEGLDLSSWRIAANGAEKIYPRTLEQFATKFAPYGLKRTALFPVYGLAESTVGLAIPPLGRSFYVDYVDRKQFEEEGKALPSTEKKSLAFVGCGKPLEGHAIRIVNDEDKALPERHVGNLQFRGPSNMQGYYNNPKATQAAFHDGWIDSGDLAYMAEGEIFITGRRKDLIIKAGRNIYPAELEECVETVSGIRKGCTIVFGATDNQRGTEQLIVVAETREKDKQKRLAISDHIREVISSALDIVPDDIVLVAPHVVPKTSSGKLQRAACKKMYLEGRLGKAPPPPWLQIARLGGQSLLSKSSQWINRLAKFLYTTYVVLVMVITLLPAWLIALFGSREVTAKACKMWANIFQRAVFWFPKVTGSDNLNKVSPIIFAANHASYIDSIVMLGIVPLGTRFIGKKELLKKPILRTFLHKMDFIGVDRVDLSKGLEDTIYIEDTLKEGHSILIFPEGTFSYAAGLRPFRLGAFKVAIQTNTPICPISLKGTRSILRDDEKLSQPGFITVTICEPIYPEGSEWQDVIHLRNEVRNEIAKHCGEPSLDFISPHKVAPSRSKYPQDNNPQSL